MHSLLASAMPGAAQRARARRVANSAIFDPVMYAESSGVAARQRRRLDDDARPIERSPRPHARAQQARERSRSPRTDAAQPQNSRASAASARTIAQPQNGRGAAPELPARAQQARERSRSRRTDAAQP